MTLKPFNPRLTGPNRYSTSTNGERAARAERIIHRYKQHELGESGPCSETEVGDLIADLLHWMHRAGDPVEFSDLLDIAETAHRNFSCETNGEGEYGQALPKDTN